MYEEKINDIIQNIKNDIEKDKLEVSKIRKEINKLKKCIKESQELEINNENLETELITRNHFINSIKQKITNKKKALYRLYKAMDLLK